MTNCPICQKPDNATIGSSDFHGTVFTFSCQPCAKQIAQELKDLALQHGAEYSTKGTMLTGPKGSPHIHRHEQLLKLVYPEILLVKTECQDDYAEHECDWAILKITPKLRQKLLGYKATCSDAKKQNEDLYEMEFFDYTPDFIRDTESLEEFIADGTDVFRLNSHDWLKKEGPLPLRSYLHINAQRVDATTIRISEAGFRWETTPKHCGFTIETTLIEWEALDHFFGDSN